MVRTPHHRLVAFLFAVIALFFGFHPFVASAATGVPCPYSWNLNLTPGSSSDDVLNLQRFLNTDTDTLVAASGAGSAGMETRLYGGLTKKAVSKFQQKYASDILIPNHLSAGTGIVGPATRAKLNALCTGATAPAPQSAASAPSSASVQAAPTQPPQSLAPSDALYVPFTRFMVTAGQDDLTITSVVVRRSGEGSDDSFADVGITDDTGYEFTYGYLNANHEATLHDPFTVPAGTSQTFTVVGDMAFDLTGEDGEMPGLDVVSVTASDPVAGSFPISGTNQRINSTLAIGSASATISGSDPQADRTRYITDTGVTFSGIRVMAGSAEDVRVNSITWEQSGSASMDDITHITTVVNGVSYPTTTDGRYYTSVFPEGIVIPRGDSLDLSVKGDIGTTGSNRTVKFDIENGSDVDITGLTYGFNIFLVAADHTDVSGNSVFLTSDGTPDTDALTPFFSGSQVTISPGAFSGISN